MKLKVLLLLLFGLSGYSLTYAQGIPDSPTIIDELHSGGAKATVRVTADPAINQLIGLPMSYTNVGSGDVHTLKTTGYRVQAFSGNDPRHSKDEALSRERKIKEVFFDAATYLTYKSPKWSLRIGDFRTKEEAAVFMQQLKSTFPEFGREMYIVRDEINIPLDNRK